MPFALLPQMVVPTVRTHVVATVGQIFDGGIAELRDELPSSPALLAREKGVKTLVPSPLGRGLG